MGRCCKKGYTTRQILSISEEYSGVLKICAISDVVVLNGVHGVFEGILIFSPSPPPIQLLKQILPRPGQPETPCENPAQHRQPVKSAHLLPLDGDHLRQRRARRHRPLCGLQSFLGLRYGRLRRLWRGARPGVFSAFGDALGFGVFTVPAAAFGVAAGFGVLTGPGVAVGFGVGAAYSPLCTFTVYTCLVTPSSAVTVSLNSVSLPSEPSFLLFTLTLAPAEADIPKFSSSTSMAAVSAPFRGLN